MSGLLHRDKNAPVFDGILAFSSDSFSNLELINFVKSYSHSSLTCFCMMWVNNEVTTFFKLLVLYFFCQQNHTVPLKSSVAYTNNVASSSEAPGFLKTFCFHPRHQLYDLIDLRLSTGFGWLISINPSYMKFQIVYLTILCNFTIIDGFTWSRMGSLIEIIQIMLMLIKVAWLYPFTSLH